jgi:hypothetical protein
MLWRVKLPSKQRRVILSAFAAGAISAVPAVVNLAVVVTQDNPPTPEWFCSMSIVVNAKVRPITIPILKIPYNFPAFQAAVTLTVCNLLVIVTFIYSMFWKKGDTVVTDPEETKDKPSRSDGHYTSLGTAPITTGTSILTLTEISGTSFSSVNMSSDPGTTIDTRDFSSMSASNVSRGPLCSQL